MKRILLFTLSLLLLLALVACDKDSPLPIIHEEEPADTAPLLDPAKCYTGTFPISAEPTDFVQVTMQGGATFVVELYPQYAPETVKNFQDLVATGFYNGLTFHRIYAGFVIQGGDPEGNGYGSSEKTIKGEFKNNGFEQNTLSHERGVLSMARATDPDSASCQFFVVLSDSAKSSLDNRYAGFGKVIYGMETIDTIAALPVTTQISGEKSKPVTAPVMEKLEFVTVEVPE